MTAHSTSFAPNAFAPGAFGMAIEKPRGYDFLDFGTFKEFETYHNSVEDSSHYEIIQGRQALYFDFDGALETQPLVEAIRDQVSFPIRIDLYSSCDRTKQSYHVIVKGIHFNDHLQCGLFARKVMTSITKQKETSFNQSSLGATNGSSPMPNGSSFDASVYSSKRNLRLLGSRKLHSTRVKRYDRLLFRSEDFRDAGEMSPLALSLVSFIPTNSRLIQVESNLPFLRVIDASLTSSEMQLALSLLEGVYPKVFKFRETKGAMLFFTRMKPHMCDLCSRVHENDGAMVFKRGSKFIFKCWRNQEDFQELGDPSETIEIPIINGCEPNFVRTTPVDPNLIQKDSVQENLAKASSGVQSSKSQPSEAQRSQRSQVPMSQAKPPEAKSMVANLAEHYKRLFPFT